MKKFLSASLLLFSLAVMFTLGLDSPRPASGQNISAAPPPVSSVFGRLGAIVSAANDYAFSQLSGSASTAQIGTGTPAAGKYVDGAAGAWTVLPSNSASTLSKQDAQGSPTTGNGTDQTVYTYSMPGGSLASGKCLDIYFAVNWVASTQTIEAKIFFGGSQIADAAGTSGGNANSMLTAKVCNNSGSTTAQWYSSFTLPKSNYTQVLNGTLAVNTGSAVTIYGTANVPSAQTWQGMGWTVVEEP